MSRHDDEVPNRAAKIHLIFRTGHIHVKRLSTRTYDQTIPVGVNSEALREWGRWLVRVGWPATVETTLRDYLRRIP